MVSLKHLVSIVCLLLVAVAGVGSAVEPSTEAPFVYVSTMDDGYAEILKVFTDDSGDFECIFGEEYLQLEDMVIGPDGLLYVCARLDYESSVPLVFRLIPPVEPADCELNLCHSNVEIIYDGSSAGPSEPVAPWFNFDGDLLVSDRGGSVWRFEGISEVPSRCLYDSWICDEGEYSAEEDSCTQTTVIPTEVFSAEGLVGEGLTQLAQGHLLTVDSSAAVVWQYSMEISGEFVGPLQQLIPDPSDETSPDLNAPEGVARMSDGAVFVTDSLPNSDDGVLYMFPADGSDDVDPRVCATFSGEGANFLEAEAEDVMWLATDFSLWKVEYLKDTFTCGVTQVFPTAPQGPQKSDVIYGYEFRGVAIPPTYREGSHVDDEAYEGLVFSQGDNALQVVAGDGCEASLEVYEALRADVEALVALLPDEDPDLLTDAFLGDNGRFQVFKIHSINQSCEVPGELVNYTISSFFQYDPETSGTAAIIHCTDAMVVDDEYECEDPTLVPGFPDSPADGRYWPWEGPLCCDVIPLSNFSLTGDIPQDGRRSGTGAGFSLLVAAEKPKKLAGEEGAGGYCGLKPPVKNNASFGTPVPPDPIKLDDFPTFMLGRTLPLKFNVVDNGNMSKKKKPKEPSCEKGPYLSDLTIALSITRIAVPDGDDWIPTSVMIHPIPSGKGYIDDHNRAIFGMSGSSYHFNWKLEDLDPGIYELFMIPDDANFTPAIEYIRIK